MRPKGEPPQSRASRRAFLAGIATVAALVAVLWALGVL